MMVEQKIKKINCLVDIYQFVNKNWVDQMCFISDKEEIDQLVKEHSQGGISIPTELETIMVEEAFEFIMQQFEAKNKKSNNVLDKLITVFRRQERLTHENIDYKILAIMKRKLTQDTKLMLKDMTRSWEFTRSGSMILRLFSTLS